MASVMRLHLQYRLWISDLNAAINVLRIFDDYLVELKSESIDKTTDDQINYYKNEFIELRKELDEIRHEMYLIKMKLAAIVKNNTQAVEEIKAEIKHANLKDRYKNFKGKFLRIRKDFKKLEAAE